MHQKHVTWQDLPGVEISTYSNQRPQVIKSLGGSKRHVSLSSFHKPSLRLVSVSPASFKEFIFDRLNDLVDQGAFGWIL